MSAIHETSVTAGAERATAPDVPAGPGEAARPRYPLKLGDPWSSHARILDLLGEGRGRRLLDVGSAQGDLATHLAARGFQVTCLERDPALAQAARSQGHEVQCVDLERPLPAFPRPFDVVVLADVLEHLRDPAGSLSRILESLAPDGLVAVSVPNVAHLYVRLNLLFGRFEYADRGILDRTHLRFFTLRSFRRLLRDAGLSVESLEATPAPVDLVVPALFHGRVLSALRRAGAVLARAWKGPFAYQFVAACRRGATR